MHLRQRLRQKPVACSLPAVLLAVFPAVLVVDTGLCNGLVIVSDLREVFAFVSKVPGSTVNGTGVVWTFLSFKPVKSKSIQSSGISVISLSRFGGHGITSDERRTSRTSASKVTFSRTSSKEFSVAYLIIFS